MGWRADASALDLAAEHGGRGDQTWAWRLRAEIVCRRDPRNLDEAEGQYRQSAALASALRMGPLVAHCHLGLGKLYRCTGKTSESNEHLATAATMYRDMGMTYWLEKAEAEMRDSR